MPGHRGALKNILSFDIEEYFHGPAYSHIPAEQWNEMQSYVVENVEMLADILGGQKATFFVVGWTAERYPSLLKGLHKQGHEIGCHGLMHRHIWDLTPKMFKEDLVRAKAIIEDITGTRVIGFRAPTFSIIQNTYWALEIIREAGFEYDSSIFPIRHDRYGIPGSPRYPYEILAGLWEVPLSTIRVAGQNIPFGGGGYFRLYPYWLTSFMGKCLNREGAPIVFYQHPWELDRTIHVKPKSLGSKIRRGLSIGRPESKLKRLIQEFEFVPIGEFLKGSEL